MTARVGRLLVLGGFAAGALYSQSEQSAALSHYCQGCHNAKVKSGDFVMDPSAVSHPEARPEEWVRKLRGRSMPPAGLPRPDEATYRSLTTTIAGSLDRSAELHPNPGRTDTFRRLNRTEYHNAIRDLLSLDVDVSSLLPGDDASHGFDNVTVGNLSPTLLERYLSAARKISRLAVGSPIHSPGGDTFNLPPDLTQEEHLDELPLGTRGGTSVHYTFPLDAEYDFQLRLARDRNEHVEGLKGPGEVEVMLDGQRIKVFTVTPPPKGEDHHLVDKDLNVRVPVKAGPHVVSVAFLKTPSLLLETERQPYQAHFNMDRHPRIHPALYSVSVNGPYSATGPGDTPSRRQIFVCKPSRPDEEDDCAKRILAKLTRRAYRRPVTQADMVRPFRFFQEARKESGFEAGIEMALSAVLVSPEFLFRVEEEPAGVAPQTAYKISDVELAARLSFFLWSSIPDDELLDLATRGKLRSPGVLEKQVKRMLADSRSQALVTNFAEQWLQLRRLAAITPDMRLFPDFDDNLRKAFLTETDLFVQSILLEDRSVLNLLRANYTFVNERLAKHYGIPNIYGSRFRRVTFEDNTERGGLLRQGSVLMVTSYATRTSPVIRGKWILDNVLGAPPQPPPPFVPTLKEHQQGAKVQTMRERIAEHRANPACAGCHNVMDPLGFSLENYDAVGRWRATEENLPIDASGGLPDGSKFTGAVGLQKALLNRPDIFAGTVTEKLLTYALGRGVELYDEPAVRGILREAEPTDYRFSAIVMGIVHSTPFQMRRSR
jgi:Protein of unknown function (DUF1592)/Protein of unknown function (DUF1588)/Protein of unknown function (DUF1585)/Protein of unknown function (DUF1587)/Protein of unknown function (DUF1595)